MEEIGLHSRVVPPPGGTGRSVVELGSLAQSPVPLALGSETSGLSVLVDRVADPVDAGVSADGLVRGASTSVSEGETI